MWRWDMFNDSKIKSDSYISIGKNIQKLRLERSYTQAYMIREMQLLGCKTTKQNYSKYEKDLAHISASELVAIAQILNVTLEELFSYRKN